jgi:PadR family transcriptional regulator, regulatory protein PadR
LTIEGSSDIFLSVVERNALLTDKSVGLVQGTLDMLILKTLALQALHGYGIAMRIEQISKGVFQVNPGSLFPAFRRLERGGWLTSEWRETENSRRAKYYALTALGRKQLKGETREWARQTAAIARILEAES